MENKIKIKVLAFALLIGVILLIILWQTPKNCRDNEECFNERANLCKLTGVTAVSKGNTFRYEIRGKKPEACIIRVTILHANNDLPSTLKKALEGKGMLCEVPLKILAKKPLSQFEELNDYCTGPLKETLLEISLENLYKTVVKQLGPFATQFKQSLEASLNKTA